MPCLSFEPADAAAAADPAPAAAAPIAVTVTQSFASVASSDTSEAKMLSEDQPTTHVAITSQIQVDQKDPENNVKDDDMIGESSSDSDKSLKVVENGTKSAGGAGIISKEASKEENGNDADVMDVDDAELADDGILVATTAASYETEQLEQTPKLPTDQPTTNASSDTDKSLLVVENDTKSVSIISKEASREDNGSDADAMEFNDAELADKGTLVVTAAELEMPVKQTPNLEIPTEEISGASKDDSNEMSASTSSSANEHNVTSIKTEMAPSVQNVTKNPVKITVNIPTRKTPRRSRPAKVTDKQRDAARKEYGAAIERLKVEIDRRNVDRSDSDRLDKFGNIDDLLNTIIRDDAALAACAAITKQTTPTASKQGTSKDVDMVDVYNVKLGAEGVFAAIPTESEAEEQLEQKQIPTLRIPTEKMQDNVKDDKKKMSKPSSPPARENKAASTKKSSIQKATKNPATTVTRKTSRRSRPAKVTDKQRDAARKVYGAKIEMLKEEIDRRNVDRSDSDRLDKFGNIDDLLNTIVRDDAALAACAAITKKATPTASTQTISVATKLETSTGAKQTTTGAKQTTSRSSIVAKQITTGAKQTTSRSSIVAKQTTTGCRSSIVEKETTARYRRNRQPPVTEKQRDAARKMYGGTIEKLKAEIDRRNADGRSNEDRLDKFGNIDGLLNTLVRDDARQSPVPLISAEEKETKPKSIAADMTRQEVLKIECCAVENSKQQKIVAAMAQKEKEGPSILAQKIEQERIATAERASEEEAKARVAAAEIARKEEEEKAGIAAAMAQKEKEETRILAQKIQQERVAAAERASEEKAKARVAAAEIARKEGEEKARIAAEIDRKEKEDRIAAAVARKKNEERNEKAKQERIAATAWAREVEEKKARTAAKVARKEEEARVAADITQKEEEKKARIAAKKAEEERIAAAERAREEEEKARISEANYGSEGVISEEESERQTISDIEKDDSDSKVRGKTNTPAYALLSGQYRDKRTKQTEVVNVSLTRLPATLGRTHKSDSPSFFGLGSSKELSRLHAVIYYVDGNNGSFEDSEENNDLALSPNNNLSHAGNGHFVIKCLSKNKIAVDGMMIDRGQTAVLRHFAAIRMATYSLYFLLPEDSPARKMPTPKKKYAAVQRKRSREIDSSKGEIGVETQKKKRKKKSATHSSKHGNNAVAKKLNAYGSHLLAQEERDDSATAASPQRKASELQSSTGILQRNVNSARQLRSHFGTGLVALDIDRTYLNESVSITRKSIEVFQATEYDAKRKMPGRSNEHPILPGQIGLRCLHCREATMKGARPARAIVFPVSTQKIYRAILDMKTKHLMVCPSVPYAIKSRLAELRFEGCSNVGVGKAHTNHCAMSYTIAAAKKIGCVDAPNSSGVFYNPYVFK